MPHLFDLTPAAKADLADIARYTNNKWGKIKAMKYARRLDQCFLRIAKGKDSSKAPLPNHDAIRVCRCEHHFVFYLKTTEKPIILAVLHERMDLIERLKERLPS